MTQPAPANTSGASRLSGGRSTWAVVLAGELADATCLWQDLDGLHVGPAPAAPPPTTLVWGWTATGTLLRLRLDGETVFLARWDGGGGTTTLAWPPTEGRVLAYRGVERTAGGLGTAYVEVTVHPDDPDAAHGPVTFIRPADPRAIGTARA